MAKTIINLSDPVSVFVSKTNTISSHIGDITALTVGGSVDSDIVQAINHLNSNIQSSAQIIATAKSGLQKDSANAIGFDSSQGRFFVPTGTINSDMLENLAVTTPRIAADAIDGTKIADDAINSEHYVDGSIDTQHIADDQITEAKMADDAIGSNQLSNLSTLLIKDVAGNTLKTIHGAGT